jgi:hypothetical protein
MQFHVQTSLAVLSFALLASVGFAQAAPRVAADNDTTLTIAQNESQEVEGEARDGRRRHGGARAGHRERAQIPRQHAGGEGAAGGRPRAAIGSIHSACYLFPLSPCGKGLSAASATREHRRKG